MSEVFSTFEFPAAAGLDMVRVCAASSSVGDDADRPKLLRDRNALELLSTRPKQELTALIHNTESTVGGSRHRLDVKLNLDLTNFVEVFAANGSPMRDAGRLTHRARRKNELWKLFTRGR